MQGTLVSHEDWNDQDRTLERTTRKLELEKTPWSPYGVNAQETAPKSTPKSISGQEKEHETGKERSF